MSTPPTTVQVRPASVRAGGGAAAARARRVAWPVGAVVGGAAFVLIASGGDAAAWVSATLAVVIGWSFLASGHVLWTRDERNVLGPAMTGLVLVWLSGAAFGEAGSDLASWVGSGLVVAAVAMFVHVVVAFPEGRLGSRGERRNGRPGAPADVPLLRVERVSKGYRAGDAVVQAVADVSLDLRRGEVLGLVGESGSGKTSLARCIAGLAEPSAGSLEVDGDAVPWPLRERPTDVRNAVQMVFQNPDGALNPSLRVDRLLRRTLRRLGGDGDAGLEELAALVRLSPGELELRPVHSPAG